MNYNNLKKNLFSEFRDPSHHHKQPPPQHRQQQQQHHNPIPHPPLHVHTQQKSTTPTDQDKTASSHTSTDQSNFSHTNSSTNDQPNPTSTSTDNTHGTPGGTIFLDEETVNKVKKTTTDSIHEINKVYHDMEQNLMRRINESNTKRFRLILIGDRSFYCVIFLH